MIFNLLIIFFSSLIVWFIIGNTRKEKKQFLSGVKFRGCDKRGCGHFNARRSGGRKHKGIDLFHMPDTVFKAPINCVISRIGKVYINYDYQLIEVLGTGIHKDLKLKIMYVSPLSYNEVGKEFQQGEAIGIVEDITKKYSGITPHVHLEVYKNNKIINPEQFL